MKINAMLPDPLVCPLCGQANGCLNLGAQDVNRTCWCNDPAIVFPEALLASIPAQLRGKACICKSCVLRFSPSEQELVTGNSALDIQRS